MVTFPNAKINLGLSVTGKRNDGYHNIESVFYPVRCCDILEAGFFEDTAEKFNFYGENIEGNPESNLIARAHRLLCTKFNDSSEIIQKLNKLRFHLYKKIPSGAGLGGGSADGAFALKMINELLQLHLPDEKLEEYAMDLGSDCVFFIRNKPAVVKGRGEIIQAVPLDLSGYYLTLIHPGIHISTADAYSKVQPEKSKFNYSDIHRIPVSEWKNHLQNDFEKSVFEYCPLIDRIKKSCYEKGALYAQMSGSGSAVYAITQEEESAGKIAMEITGPDYRAFHFPL